MLRARIFVCAAVAAATSGLTVLVRPLALAAPSFQPVLDKSNSEWVRMEAAGDIQFDPETGNYRIYYKGLDGQRKYWVFEPRSKVKVKVDAQVTQDASGAYLYRYTVHNLDSSPQHLDGFGIRYAGAEIYGVVQPDPLWAFFPQVGLVDAPEPVALWGSQLWPDATEADVPGIPPGHSASAFGFTSREPPGLVTCYAVGYVPGPRFMDPDSEAIPDPRPKLLGDCAIGTTIGPSPQMALAPNKSAPLAQALYAAGWSVAWDGASKRLSASKGARRLALCVGDVSASLDGKPVSLDRPATVVAGRLQVPQSFIRHLLTTMVAKAP